MGWPGSQIALNIWRLYLILKANIMTNVEGSDKVERVDKTRQIAEEEANHQEAEAALNVVVKVVATNDTISEAGGCESVASCNKEQVTKNQDKFSC